MRIAEKIAAIYPPAAPPELEVLAFIAVLLLIAAIVLVLFDVWSLVFRSYKAGYNLVIQLLIVVAL